MNIACTIALVLLMDVSASVGEKDFHLQQQGLSQAFADPALQHTIVSQPNGVAITLIHWGTTPKTVVPWTHLRTVYDSAEFGQTLGDVRWRHAGNMTAMGNAINYAINSFEDSPCEPEQKIIDISGDGESNSGVDPAVARDRAAQALITINALAVLNKLEPEADTYFRDKVVTPDGFVMVVDAQEDFARAIRRKLSLEISRLKP
jgi:Ca-activated chloride channel homolog